MKRLTRFGLSAGYLLLVCVTAYNAFLGPYNYDQTQATTTAIWMILFSVLCVSSVPFYNKKKTVFVQFWALIVVSIFGLYGCFALRYVTSLDFWNTAGNGDSAIFGVAFAVNLVGFITTPAAMLYRFSKFPRILTGLVVAVLLMAPTVSASVALLQMASL